MTTEIETRPSTRREMLKTIGMAGIAGLVGAPVPARALASCLGVGRRGHCSGVRSHTLPLGFAPNIVFLLTDDGPRNSYGRAENCFSVVSDGYRGHWASYPNASCNDPLCAPGRAATLSGLVSQHHHVVDNHTGSNLDLDATWIKALHDAGYLCGGYGKLINGWGVEFGSTAEIPPGFDDFRMLVSEPGYFDYVLNENGTPTYHGYNDTNTWGTDYLTDLSRCQILDFIDNCTRTQPGRPWAAYWAANSPHRDSGATALPPARYANLVVPMVDPPNFNTGPQAQLPWLRVAQEREPLDVDAIHYEHLMAMRALKAVDDGLRAIIDDLNSRSLLDRTVIVVATDNSHIYGAYGLQDKGTAFEDSLNYLLRVRCPGIDRGARRQAISNIDIAPFLCDLGGTNMPGKVDGRSFSASLFNASAPFREAAPVCHAKDGWGTPAFDGLRFPDRKVIVGRAGGYAEGQQWMHDLVSDPWELAGKPPSTQDLAKLKAMLDGF